MKKEVKMRNKNAETALMYAARNGHLECVKLLAPQEKGMRDSHGDTAMRWASLQCRSYLSQFPEEL